MKLFTYRTVEFRPGPFPCAELFELKITYLFGLIRVKTIKTKIR